MNLINPDAWNMFAGGISAAKGKKSYSVTIPGVGKYFISPICYKDSLRHKGYIAQFTNIFGKIVQSGLYHELCSCGTLTQCRKACQQHLVDHDQSASAGTPSVDQ